MDDLVKRTGWLSSWGVRARLTVISAVVVALALGIGAAVTLLMLHQANMNAMYKATGRQAYQIATALRHGGVAAVDADDLAPGAGVSLVQVIEGRSAVVAASPGAPRTAVLLDVPSRSGDAPEYYDDVRVPTLHGVYCASTVRADFGGRSYTVVALDQMTGIRSSEWTVGVIMALEMPVIIALAAIAVYVLVGRSLRPVSQISSRVNRITASELNQRVPVPPTRDEIATLATTMNGMLGRLESSHQSQLRFVGDASHELRSPLTTVVGLLDLSDDSGAPVDVETVREVLLPEARRMHRIIDDLLLLARADEGGLPTSVVDVDLDEVVDAELQRLRLISGALSICSTTTAVRVRGNRDMLIRAVRNVADNGLRYARSRLTFSLRIDGDEGVLEIGDDGPGIPQSKREFVFQRFARLDPDRRRATGAGLGLSIVREVVLAHGGRVIVTDGPDGGALIEIRLPLASSTTSLGDELRSHSSGVSEPVSGSPDGFDRRGAERRVDATT